MVFFTDSFNLIVHLLKPAPNDRNWHKTEITKQKLTICSLSAGTIENVCQQSTYFGPPRLSLLASIMSEKQLVRNSFLAVCSTPKTFIEFVEVTVKILIKAKVVIPF
ncbi:MAG: hypothetical protein AXW14_17090 [Alteromonas sp. Nap_26]|nr:MAG: hypothetical protein AXW14_17090 [Alteromonas sp. Nap_26]